MATQLIANRIAEPWTMLTRDGLAIGISDLSMAADWESVRSGVSKVIGDGSLEYVEALDVADELEKTAAAIRADVRRLFS